MFRTTVSADDYQLSAQPEGAGISGFRTVEAWRALASHLKPSLAVHSMAHAKVRFPFSLGPRPRGKARFTTARALSRRSNQ